MKGNQRTSHNSDYHNGVAFNARLVRYSPTPHRPNSLVMINQLLASFSEEFPDVHRFHKLYTSVRVLPASLLHTSIFTPRRC